MKKNVNPSDLKARMQSFKNSGIKNSDAFDLVVHLNDLVDTYNGEFDKIVEALADDRNLLHSTATKIENFKKISYREALDIANHFDIDSYIALFKEAQSEAFE